MSQLSLKFHHILYLLNLCRNISQQHHIIARKFIRLGSSPTKGLTTSCDVSRAQDLLPATLHRPRQNRTEQGQRTICLRREIRSNQIFYWLEIIHIYLTLDLGTEKLFLGFRFSETRDPVGFVCLSVCQVLSHTHEYVQVGMGTKLTKSTYFSTKQGFEVVKFPLLYTR